MIYVSHLKDAIYNKKSKKFFTIDSSNLKLWKVDILTKDKNDKLKILNIISPYEINIKKQFRGKKIYSNQKIKYYFSKDLDNE